MTQATLTINGTSVVINLTIDQIAQLTAATAPKVNPVLWQPSQDQDYFWVSTSNKVQSACNSRKDTRYDVFETREQAEAFAAYREALRIYKAAIVNYNEGWEPCWDGSSTNMFLCYREDDQSFNVDYVYFSCSFPNTFYFKDENFLDVVTADPTLQQAFLTIINYKG